MFWLLIIAASIVSLFVEMNWHDCSQCLAAHLLPPSVSAILSRNLPGHTRLRLAARATAVRVDSYWRFVGGFRVTH